jgi:hypothetical protein
MERALAMIGLLEPVGSVQASTAAKVRRCDAFRALERVRIAPREHEISLLSHASVGTDTLLVDPLNAPMVGLILSCIRPVQGISAVDGFRTEYWCAVDPSGAHKASLFDVEGPLDELNHAAVLRLRCHELRREDTAVARGMASDVSVQTVTEAKTLLLADYEEELAKMKLQQRSEMEGQRHVIQGLKHQLEWTIQELEECRRQGRAREDAMQSELTEVRKQLQAKLAATQTDSSTPPLQSAPPSEVAAGDYNGSSNARAPTSHLKESSRASPTVAPPEAVTVTDAVVVGPEVEETVAQLLTAEVLESSGLAVSHKPSLSATSFDITKRSSLPPTPFPTDGVRRQLLDPAADALHRVREKIANGERYLTALQPHGGVMPNLSQKAGEVGSGRSWMLQEASPDGYVGRNAVSSSLFSVSASLHRTPKKLQSPNRHR